MDQITVSLRDTDHKIILIPITFILLWIWHLLGNIFYVYIGMDSDNSIGDLMMLLSVSVCVCVLHTCVCVCLYKSMCVPP